MQKKDDNLNKNKHQKENYTLDNKHKRYANYFYSLKNPDSNDKEPKLNKTNHVISDEMDYYDSIGDILIDYYGNSDKKKKILHENELLDFMNHEKNISKNNLLDDYCKIIEGTKIIHENGSNRIKYCKECGIEKTLDITNSSYICLCCGNCETIIMDEDRRIKEYSPYKRLNHFKEWLNQFQAKKTPEIPNYVFNDITKELNKLRMTDLSQLNKSTMKSILKKLNYNNYYEYTIYIINKLNNVQSPKITKDMEQIFIYMFYKIQEPWELYKNKNRKNFLSYSYVLYKMCELLELNHLLKYFLLYKDNEKIIQNDKIWEKICKHLDWTFISSFK